jgi:hypothetical protein
MFVSWGKEYVAQERVTIIYAPIHVVFKYITKWKLTNFQIFHGIFEHIIIKQ